jgi:hypothetical protein
MPDERQEVILGANGAAAVVDADVLVTTSYLFRDEPSSRESATRNSLAYRQFHSIWLDTKCEPGFGAADLIASDGIGFTRLAALSNAERAKMVEHACGRDLWVSTGVWAICIAAVSNAARINVTGVSLSNGHYGEDDNSERHHVNEDRECLRLLTARHSKIHLEPELVAQL